MCVSSAALSQSRSSTVYRFLSISPDARTAGLGGAHAAIINPKSSQFVTNPAFLQRAATDRVHLSYLNHLGDIRFGSANYSRSIPNLGNVSASVRYLGYGDMSRFDDLGNDLGSTYAGDLAFSLGLGTSLTDQLSYGVALTGIHSSLAGFRSSAISVSGGLLYAFPNRETSIGAYITDAGTQITAYDSGKEPLPLNIALGVAHRLQYIPVRLHLTINRLNDWPLTYISDEGEPAFFEALPRHLIGGLEFLFGERVTARVGYDSWLSEQAGTGKRLDGAGFSFGMAIHLNALDIDFSRTSFSDMGSVVQLSVGLKIFNE